MAEAGVVGAGRARRIAVGVLLAVALVVPASAVVLLTAAWTEDAAIDRATGRTTAEVVSVSRSRTLVRYQSSDGAEHVPQVGVLYPAGLAEGQFVLVEYDAANPELVRVAGRDRTLMYLPLGTTVLFVWAVALPLLWWLRRPGPVYGDRVALGRFAL